MTTTTQPGLYPTNRGKFWFAKALRLISHNAAAQDVGTLGVCILMEVALMEDRKRYRRAPKFTQFTLADRLGVNRKTISAAILRCVNHGWLYWDQHRHNGPATAWVMIPDWVDERNLGDDGSSEIWTNEDTSEDWTDDRSSKKRTNDTPNDGANDRTNDTPSHTLPPPSPNPPPPPQRADGRASGRKEQLQIPEAGDEAALVDELGSLGIRKAVEAARSGLGKLSLQQIRRHLDHFRDCPGAWGSVVVYWRLTSPGLAKLAPDEGWPKPLPGYVAAAERKAADERAQREAVQQRQAREKERQDNIKRERDRQLLIDWERDYGPILDAMPVVEVLKLLPTPERRLTCVTMTRRASLIRVDLLRALAERSANGQQAG